MNPHDQSPGPTLPTRVLMSMVRGYRIFLSPWLGSSCRFEPTCSVYSLQAYQAHGAAAGTYLTLRRIGRCHPFCEGGCDPVPEHPPAFFRAAPLSSTSIDKTSP
ncbi:N/A [soil metagenome]